MSRLNAKIVVSELSYKSLIQAFALLGRCLHLEEDLDSFLTDIADEIAFRDGIPPFTDDCDKNSWMVGKWDGCPLETYGPAGEVQPVRVIEVADAS